MKAKALARGARATIKKGGVTGEIYSACDIPAEGAFAVRSLPPGQYTVVDSTGGWQHFEMLAGQEYAVILDGDVPGPTGEPGLSGMASSPTLHVGRAPVIRDPDQVAAGAGVADPVIRTPDSLDGPDAPGVEKQAPLPGRTRQRGLAPAEDVRTGAAAGAGIAGDEIPDEVRAPAKGPDPDRDTTVPPEETRGSELTPRPLEGNAAGAPLVDGAPAPRHQDPLGAPPAPAKKPAARRRPAKKAA